MEPAEFERAVREGFERLPARVRKKIQNVALLIEDEPSTLVRMQEKLRLGETLLGLYQGIPLSARGDTYGIGMTVPDTITLYRKSIEEAAHEDGTDVRDVIADTLWHEFAHHFGMDEHEVRKKEQKKRMVLAKRVL